MRSRSFFGMLTLLSLGLAPAAAWAQEVRTQQDPTQRQQSQRESLDREQSTTARQARTGQADEELVTFLAGKLAIMNQVETEMAQLAHNQATNQDVKQLAQRIAQSHQQLNQRLAQAMPQLSNFEGLSGQRIAAEGSRATQAGQDQQVQRPGQTGQERRPDAIDRQTAGTDAARTGTTIRGQSGDELSARTLLEICRRTAENHVQMAKQSLQNKQGHDFDACWVGAQVCAHQAMVAELKAIQNVGSSEFQQIVQMAEKESQQHLQQAEQLAERLMRERDSNSDTTRQ